LLKPGAMSRLALTALLFATGCVGDLVELTPVNKDAAGGADQAGGGGGDGGGGAPRFNPDINTDIHNLGCAAATCHGGTQVPILHDGTDTNTVMMNYVNFTADANTGESSPVLTKNLTTSGVTHGGGKNFATTADPIYVRWLAWINAGNPE
jgi:hypothetical protein